MNNPLKKKVTGAARVSEALAGLVSLRTTLNLGMSEMNAESTAIAKEQTALKAKQAQLKIDKETAAEAIANVEAILPKKLK